jgi:hypothetical protein
MHLERPPTDDMVVSFHTEVLNGLCSNDQLELLDAVDKLRLQGIDHYISLPQIIVCGDQSSGKSSVLEAISGVPFPVKSNLVSNPQLIACQVYAVLSVKVHALPHGTHPSKISSRGCLCLHRSP